MVRESPDLKREDGLGVARFVRSKTNPQIVEPAITVVEDMQHKGIGRLLLATIVEAARQRGIQTFRAEVLADNEPMWSLLREVGAEGRPTRAGTVVFDVPIDGSTGGRAGLVDRALRAVTGLTPRRS